MKPKVLVVDDQKMIRDSLYDLLAGCGRFEVFPPLASGQEVLSFLETSSADVILMDIRMPTMNGLETVAAMRARGFTDAAVIFLTLFDEPDFVYEAISQTVAGFLLKHIERDQLIRGIEVVANGGVIFDPEVARQISSFIAAPPQTARAGDDPLPALSGREVEVIALLSQGLSNKDIAGRLNLSGGTVRNHVSRIIEKLGVENRTQAVLRAFEAGLI